MNETGWIPRVVRIPILARRVRAMLEWRSSLVISVGLVRYYDGCWAAEHGKPPVPFGWLIRRVHHRNQYVVGPWWCFWREAFYYAEYLLYSCAKRLGAIDGREGDYWANHRWWPSCPRFSDMECQ